jgi:putative hydrolase of the HAD superfamily
MRYPEAMHAPIRAVIFDFDGLIVDTESAIYESWRELYAAHGHPLAIETFSHCIGSDFSDAYDPMKNLELLTGKTFDWKTVDAEREQRVREMLDQESALPGVEDRLVEAGALGLPCSIASSSSHRWVNGWLERLELRHHFANLSTRDNVQRIKPAPDLFLHAIAQLGVKAEEAVIFEDSLHGLRAAKAAGIRCIVAPGPMTRHFVFDGAWRHIGSLEEISLSELVNGA